MPEKPKLDDIVGGALPFLRQADTPLLMLMACGNCGAVHTIVSVVVPGFLFPCPTCEKKVDKGCVITCAACKNTVCANCIYQNYLKLRAALLTPQ
jgi:hypothetical protein